MAFWRGELLKVIAQLKGLQPLSPALTSWAAITRAAGFDTFAGTPSSANLRSLLTDETGTGAAVFAGSPTLTGIPVFTGIPLLTGGAISFPATQIPSAGANDLDDCEKGGWTPAITFGGAAVGVTYAGTTAGIYTKISNVVTAEGVLILTAKGSSVGAAVITGLPFTNRQTTSCSVGFWQNMATIGSISGVPSASSTTIQLFNNGAVNVAALTDANFTNTSSLRFSATYIV